MKIEFPEMHSSFNDSDEHTGPIRRSSRVCRRRNVGIIYLRLEKNITDSRSFD